MRRIRLILSLAVLISLVHALVSRTLQHPLLIGITKGDLHKLQTHIKDLIQGRYVNSMIDGNNNKNRL